MLFLLLALVACAPDGTQDTYTEDHMPTPGVTAGPDAAGRNYRYDEPKDFEYDISPWNGWVPDYHQGIDVSVTTTPPYATSDAASTLYLFRGVPLVPHNATDNPTALQTIKSITFRYFRDAAHDLCNFNIYRALKDGSGAGAAVVTYTEAAEFTATGAYATFTATPGIVIDPDYVYYMRLVMGPIDAAADVRFGPSTMTITRDGVE